MGNFAQYNKAILKNILTIGTKESRAFFLKNDNATYVKTYRPITLITAIYEIMDTIVSKRIFSIPNLLTNEHQCANNKQMHHRHYIRN